MMWVRIWLSVRQKVFDKRRWSKLDPRQSFLNHKPQDKIQNMDPFLDWRIKSDRMWECESSILQSSTRYVLQNDLSVLVYGKQALPHCSTSYRTGSQRLLNSNKSNSFNYEENNLTNFIFKQVACEKRMNGYMYTVPDTGNDDVLSW